MSVSAAISLFWTYLRPPDEFLPGPRIRWAYFSTIRSNNLVPGRSVTSSFHRDLDYPVHIPLFGKKSQPQVLNLRPLRRGGLCRVGVTTTRPPPRLHLDDLERSGSVFDRNRKFKKCPYLFFGAFSSSGSGTRKFGRYLLMDLLFEERKTDFSLPRSRQNEKCQGDEKTQPIFLKKDTSENQILDFRFFKFWIFQILDFRFFKFSIFDFLIF